MKWIKWAFAEAGFRALSMTLLKVIGNLSQGLLQIILSTFVIGSIQLIVAAIVIKVNNLRFLTVKRLVIGSIIFGITAFINTVIPFMAFVRDANITVYTFITLLAIIPGAIIDRIWFQEQLIMRQYLGIFVAIGAGWLILKTPNLSELLNLPLWVWLAGANAIFLSIGQGITRAIKEVNPWVKNFWGGLTTSILCLVVFSIYNQQIAKILMSPETWLILFWSIAIAFIVIGIWTFNVITYRDGSSVYAKHVVVSGVFMVLIILIGLFIFKEQITIVQSMGIIMYFIAFVLVNNEVWKRATNMHLD